MKKKIIFIMTLIIALTGSYICTTNATNAANEPENLKPEFIAKPSNQVVPIGGTIHIEAIVVGTQPMEVRWYKNGRTIYPNSRITITHDNGRVALDIKNADTSDSGDYSIKAENRIGMDITTCEVYVSSIKL